jgi:hypothetical protein
MSVQVDWLWVIFPAVLLALTLLFLIFIALRTLFGHGNVPMWKSSILPLMFANTGSSREDQATLEILMMQRSKLLSVFSRQERNGSLRDRIEPYRLDLMRTI